MIAIDGPAGAGKSTVARALAAELGYVYVDTGRDVPRRSALAARERGVDLADHDALAALVDGLDFALEPSRRTAGASRGPRRHRRDPNAARGGRASRVAVIPVVRTRLVERQRALGSAGGIVMDGRDIGTVVFPDADCKFFVTASVTERTRRRASELGATDSELPAIQREIEARDTRDSERAHSPLRAAPDAETVDTTGLAPAAAAEHLLKRVLERARP